MSRKKPTKRVQDYLWSESAGHCQNPECGADLHALSDRPVGEQAHIVAASADGPRGEDHDGPFNDADRASAANLLLLCPTCHTKIDKSPHLYDVKLLHEWKSRSIALREAAFGTPRFDKRSDALEWIRPLFASNKEVFDSYGPNGDIRDSDRAERWSALVTSTIIPNNAKLVKTFHANHHLLTDAESAIVAKFELHEAQLRDRHVHGNWVALSVRFPDGVLKVFTEEGTP